MLMRTDFITMPQANSVARPRFLISYGNYVNGVPTEVSIRVDGFDCHFVASEQTLTWCNSWRLNVICSSRGEGRYS